jgi:hypothetical protein
MRQEQKLNAILVIDPACYLRLFFNSNAFLGALTRGYGLAGQL